MPSLTQASGQHAEPSDTSLEQAPRPLGLSDRPYQFEVIPQVCLIGDVCHFLQMSERQVYRLLSQRKLALVELDLDSTRRFTGESVARVIRQRKASR